MERVNAIRVFPRIEFVFPAKIGVRRLDAVFFLREDLAKPLCSRSMVETFLPSSPKRFAEAGRNVRGRLGEPSLPEAVLQLSRLYTLTTEKRRQAATLQSMLRMQDECMVDVNSADNIDEQRPMEAINIHFLLKLDIHITPWHTFPREKQGSCHIALFFHLEP